MAFSKQTPPDASISKKEWAAALRRREQAANRRARTLPPPAASDKRDPLTGSRVHANPAQPGSDHVPVSSHPAAGVPAVNATNETWLNAAAPSWLDEPPAPAPSGFDTPEPVVDQAWRSSPSGSSVPFEGQPSTTWKEAILKPLERKAATWALPSGWLLGVAGALMALVWGTPVLLDAWSLETLVTGTVVAVAGFYLVAVSWENSPPKIRISGTGIGLLLVAAVLAGVAGDPVVVDGKVLLSTSSRAQAAKLSDEIYKDLVRMQNLDQMLVADMATARADVAEYKPAIAEALALNKKYEEKSTDSLPDPLFEPIIKATQAAANWEAEALSAKLELINAESNGAAATLERNRVTFYEQWAAAGKQLGSLAAALDIPASRSLEGPHE